MPAQRLCVMQLRVGEATGCARPFVVRLYEQRPVRLVLRKALAELLRFVVDLADGFARGQLVRGVLDARLVHKGLAVDLGAVEAYAALERPTGQVLHHHVRVMRGPSIRAGAELARG